MAFIFELGEMFQVLAWHWDFIWRNSREDSKDRVIRWLYNTISWHKEGVEKNLMLVYIVKQRHRHVQVSCSQYQSLELTHYKSDLSRMVEVKRLRSIISHPGLIMVYLNIPLSSWHSVIALELCIQWVLNQLSYTAGNRFLLIFILNYTPEETFSQ